MANCLLAMLNSINIHYIDILSCWYKFGNYEDKTCKKICNNIPMKTFISSVIYDLYFIKVMHTLSIIDKCSEKDTTHFQASMIQSDQKFCFSLSIYRWFLKCTNYWNFTGKCEFEYDLSLSIVNNQQAFLLEIF